HSYQSVCVSWSSIWVAALDAPKRKLPLPEAAELDPKSPNTMSFDPPASGMGGIVLPAPLLHASAVKERSVRAQARMGRSMDSFIILRAPARTALAALALAACAA